MFKSSYCCIWIVISIYEKLIKLHFNSNVAVLCHQLFYELPSPSNPLVWHISNEWTNSGKPQLAKPLLREAVPFEISNDIIHEYSFHCLISLTSSHFRLATTLNCKPRRPWDWACRFLHSLQCIIFLDYGKHFSWEDLRKRKPNTRNTEKQKYRNQ